MKTVKVLLYLHTLFCSLPSKCSFAVHMPYMKLYFHCRYRSFTYFFNISKYLMSLFWHCPYILHSFYLKFWLSYGPWLVMMYVYKITFVSMLYFVVLNLKLQVFFVLLQNIHWQFAGLFCNFFYLNFDFIFFPCQMFYCKFVFCYINTKYLIVSL